MSLILNIDTAGDTASVCLSENEKVREISYSENQKDHASWLHVEIAELMRRNGCRMKDLVAVAVSAGPGSYTGLRVGMAAAKGFCYALEIPLVTVNSLKIIAFASRTEGIGQICPLIDARRMEVFTALYNDQLEEKTAPHSRVVDDKTFFPLLLSGKVLFCGSGVKKLQPFLTGSNALFSTVTADAGHLAQLAFISLSHYEFADLAYAEPLYVKEFHLASRSQ